MTQIKPTDPERCCQRCGISKTDEAIEVHLPHKKEVVRLCQKCKARTLSFSKLISLLSAGTLGFWIISGSHNFHWFVWTILVGYFFFGHLMVMVHEFAHAFAAWSVGMEVKTIAVGSGRRICRLRLGEAFFDLHLKPSGGLCTTSHRNKKRYWRNSVWMVVAGPIVHVIALASIVVAWKSGHWGAEENPSNFHLVVEGFFAWNVLALLNLLVPGHFTREGVRRRNDGAALLDLWFNRQSVWKRMIEHLAKLGDAGKWNEVRDIGRAYLRGRSTTNPIIWRAVASWTAVGDLWMGTESSLHEADELSAKCMSIGKSDGAVMTVRACVLFASGRIEDAYTLLTSAEKMQQSGSAEKAASHLWVELYRRRNEFEKTAEWEAIAARIDPKHVYRILKREVQNST